MGDREFFFFFLGGGWGVGGMFFFFFFFFFWGVGGGGNFWLGLIGNFGSGGWRYGFKRFNEAFWLVLVLEIGLVGFDAVLVWSFFFHKEHITTLIPRCSPSLPLMIKCNG